MVSFYEREKYTNIWSNAARKSQACRRTYRPQSNLQCPIKPESIIEEFIDVYDRDDDDWEDEILFPVLPHASEERIEIEGEPEVKITNQEILSAWKIVRNGLLQRGDQEILDLTKDLTRHLVRISFEGRKKQGTLDTFLISNSNPK